MRRGQSIALALLALGALGLLLASGRGWGTVALPTGPRLDAGSAAVPGSTLAGGLPALALGVLAGTGAVLATRGWGRVAVGALLCVLGAGALAAVVVGLLDRSDRVAAVPAVRDLAGPARLRPSVALTAWPLVAVLAAAAVLTGGLLVVLRGRAWSALSARYEIRADARGAAPASAARRAPLDEAATAWAALDRGEDPTATGSPPPGDR